MKSKYTRFELFRKSGIYKIYSIDKVYIGSSRCLYRRESGHRNGLLKNTHYNKKLQNFYNKYGKDSLVFEVVEFCLIEELYEREKYYIEKFNSIKKGFNINPPYKNSGIKLSEEHKQKIRDGHSKSKLKNRDTFLKNLEKARQGFNDAVNSGKINRKLFRLGYKTSEESKLKQRNAKLGKKRNWKNMTIQQFSEKMKLRKQGEKSHFAKLKESDVIKIKELLLLGIRKKIIAIQFNISLPTIYDIHSKRSWSHI